MILLQYISKSGKDLYQHDIPNRCFLYKYHVEAEVKVTQAKQK